MSTSTKVSAPLLLYQPTAKVDQASKHMDLLLRNLVHRGHTKFPYKQRHPSHSSGSQQPTGACEHQVSQVHRSDRLRIQRPPLHRGRCKQRRASPLWLQRRRGYTQDHRVSIVACTCDLPDHNDCHDKFKSIVHSNAEQHNLKGDPSSCETQAFGSIWSSPTAGTVKS